MVEIRIQCPACQRDEVVKRGKTSNGKQRYLCQNQQCKRQTFLNDYSYKAYFPGVREQIIEMAINASGIRDTSRVLGISKDTVSSALKKKRV